LKNFEKSLIPSLLPKFLKSTFTYSRSALLVLGFCSLNYIFLFVISSSALLAQANQQSTIYPYFVSGPLAEQALELQVIDLHFKNSADLLRSYVYLRDAEISGANDLINGSADTWVNYSILSPSETELMGHKPALIEQLNKWGVAATQVSLKMAANQTSDGKSILLKKLQLQDAQKLDSGEFKVRIVVQALEGNDINRFGLFVTEQPTKGLISQNARISTPFLNILDDKTIGNAQWSVMNPSSSTARASLFLSHSTSQISYLRQYLVAKNNTAANWESIELAEAGSRLIGSIAIEGNQSHFFKTQPLPNNSASVRIYIAQNAKLLDLENFSVENKVGFEQPQNTVVKNQGVNTEDNSPSTQNDKRENSVPEVKLDLAKFDLVVTPTSNDCGTYEVTLVAQSSGQMNKLRQVSWSNNGLLNSGKTKATYTTSSQNNGSTVITLDIQYLENKKLKTVQLSKEIRQNIPPKADGGINRTAEINEFITFDGTLSEDVDGQIREYFWDFGDGTTKNGARIEHKYQQTGSYQVVLTVVDNIGGQCGVSTDTIQVSINKEPVIVLSPDIPSKIGKNQYNVGQSYDEDGQITDITWYLNNEVVGKSPFIDINLKASDSPLRVVITDNSFARNAKSERIIYPQTANVPKADAGKDQVIAPGSTAVLQADATTANSQFPIVSYEWNIGKETFTGKRISKTFPDKGTYKATLTVKDSRGLSDQDVVTVYVNSPPTARFSITEISGNEVKLSGSSSFDPDKQALQYNWKFGNESTANTAEVVYTFGKAGKYLISLTVNDGSGAPNATNTFSQEISIGSSTDTAKKNEIIASTEKVQDEKTASEKQTENSPSVEKPTKKISVLPFSEAKIEGPASVFVGQKAFFTLKTTDKKPEAIFWDNGEGISGNGNELSISFDEAGIRQITAIFFEKTANGTNEQYLTTEVEIIDRRKEDSILEAIVAHNRNIIAGRHVQLMLNANKNVDDIFERKDERFKKVLYQTKSESSEKALKSWKRFTGFCENQTYDLMNFFGLPQELIEQDRLYVFINGKLILPSEFSSKAIDLAAISAYEIRVYYPETVLQESEDLVFKHFLSVDASPEINASVPSSVKVDAWKTYSAANSFDSDGQVLRFYWEMGDGLRYSGKTIRHQYVHTGVYEIKLVIESGKGLSDCERIEKRWSVEVTE
jgi:PKD repeat protein